MDVTIRRATLDESSQLTSIALASKAVWGNVESFMKQCREELTITVDYIRSGEVYVVFTPTFEGLT